MVLQPQMRTLSHERGMAQVGILYRDTDRWTEQNKEWYLLKNRPILGGFLLSATAVLGRGNPIYLTFTPTYAILRGSGIK